MFQPQVSKTKTYKTITKRLKKLELGDVLLAALAAFSGSLLATQDWGRAALVAAIYAAARAIVGKVYELSTGR